MTKSLARCGILILMGAVLPVTVYGAQPVLSMDGVTVTPHMMVESMRYLREPEPATGARVQLFLRNQSPAETDPLVIDGVREVLDALQGKYLMGIVTSSGHEHFEIIHRQSSLLPYFQFFLTLKDCPYTKPHPGPYLKAIALSGFAPEECLVIEDSPRGLVSAVNAGIRCLVVPSRFTRGGDFPGAFQILNNIRELPATLEELQAGILN